MNCRSASLSRAHRSAVVHRAGARRGAMIVLMVFILPVLLIMAAFAVNVAYMELSRTELRAASDFSARAGARTLSLTGSQTQALTVARAFAAQNEVGHASLSLVNGDYEFGRVTRDGAGTYQFTATTVNPNAMRVFANRGGSNAPIGLFLGTVIGQDQFTPHLTSTAAQVDRDIAIVLDRSGSMASTSESGGSTGWDSGQPAPSNSRWMKCVEGINVFLTALQDTPMEEKVALITYSDQAVIDQHLTLNYSSMPAAIDVYTQAYVTGMTNISDGIDVARQVLLNYGTDRPWASKTIVVLTDGIHNVGTMTPAEAATAAAAQGIVVHTITYGNDANVTQMETVAASGNGQHWHAPNTTQLIRAFNEIADNCPTMLVQ